MAIKQLYSTREFGEAIGGVSPAGVIDLIRARKVRAKLQRVRRRDPRKKPPAKEKPRLFIPASELERYLRELPDWEPDDEKSKGKRKPKRASSEARAQVDGATQYYDANGQICS